MQVKVHRFDREPFLAAVDGVGAGREFYSPISVGDTLETLDERITDYENELAKHLKYLLKLESGSTAEPKIASQFVVHLVTRNDHFRQATTYASKTLFEAFTDKLSSVESARHLLGVSRQKPSRKFQEAMENAVQERPELLSQTGLSHSELVDRLTQYAVQNFSKFHSEMVGPARMAFDDIATGLYQIVADAQRGALERDLVPKLHVEKLTNHTWTVFDAKTELVLPDCVGISSARKGIKVPLMLAEDSQTESIFVPLTKRRLLIASRSGGLKKVDTNYLNRHFARCSWDFFVSDVDADLPTNLRMQIRKNTMEILANLTSSAFNEIEN